MSALEIILGIALLIFSIAITIVVVFQEGQSEGLGVITGGADSFLSKNKARSVDAFLSRWTKVFAIVFFLLVIGLNAVAFFK